MTRKVNKNLVALGSAAIVAVYGIGFARTASSATATPDSASAPAIAAATVTPAGSQPLIDLARTVATTTTTPTPGAAVTSAAPTATPAATTANGTAAAYQDGTYTGTGTSRFGNITVAVTIQGGSISGVTLTKVTTSYRASRIAGLPGQVVARQSANVDLVSGATYSSQAFKTAVAQALAQAATGSARG